MPRHRSLLALTTVILAVALLPSITTAQEIIVFDDWPAIPGDADNTWGQRTGLDQPILVIPVISQDTPFDPDNNLLNTFDPLNANLQQDLIDKFAEMNDLWQENSYGLVSFDVDVLDRYYQMPREVDHYFNPAYVIPRLQGTAIQGPNVDVPTGHIRLVLHISDADETAIDLAFDAADSPWALVDLLADVDNTVTAVVGDELDFSAVPCGGDCDSFRFDVPTSYTREGTFAHIDFGASDEGVLDALGLDRPDIDLAAVRVTGVGAEFPYTTTTGEVLTITVENGVDPPDVFDYIMGADVFNDVAAFVATHGATHPEVTLSSVGGELRIDVVPTIAAPITEIRVTGPRALLDRLGLDRSTEQDGVVTWSKRNTIKGDRRITTGQAAAAYILNELTRDPAAPGPDPIPNLDIIPANDAAIRNVVEAEIDPYRILAVIFLDAPNKRAGAAGGYIPIGFRNGGFEPTHISAASVQIQYDFSSAATIAHETGHNIGFADLYNNSNGEYDPALRYPVDWDIMHAEGDEAHTGAWHKEINNGWLVGSGANVAVMPEPAATGNVDTERYVLTPLELPADAYDDVLAGVPAGRTVAKTVRLPVGLGIAGDDHFLLVQNRQPGPQFSQNLPVNPAAAAAGGVYLTDAISRSSFDFFRPSTRNFVHPLTDEPLVMGNVAPIIDKAPATDVDVLATYPAYDGLDIDIVGEIPGPAPFAAQPSYLIDVTREQKDYLELGLTPWGAPPWESPDIWIEHGDKAVLSDVPLAGNGEPARWSADYDPAANGGNPLNWIRAKITNSGTVDATAVQIRVKLNTPGAMGDDGAWVIQPLSDPVDIPAGESRILQVAWNPSVKGHTCVQVEVYRWTSVLGDRDPWNNKTQENVTLFQPTANSPWGATPFSFEVANGRSFDMEVAIQPDRLPPGLILSLDQWLVQVPAESRVTVNGVLTLDDAIIPPPEGIGTDPDRVRPFKPTPIPFNLSGFVVGDEYQVPAGGITYVVLPSVRVDLDTDVVIDADGNIHFTGSTSPGAPGTAVEIEIRYPSGRYEWVTVQTDGNGEFDEVIPPREDGTVRVTPRIPPGQGAAPTDGGMDVVDTRVPTPRPGRGPNALGFFFGAIVSSDSLRLDSGQDWGFRYRRSLVREWSLGAEIGAADTDSSLGDGLLVRAEAHLVGELPTSGVATPFVLVGAGLVHLNGNGRGDTANSLTLGLGADLRWSNSLGLRVDLRYLRLGSLLGSGATNSWMVQWGPTFRF